MRPTLALFRPARPLHPSRSSRSACASRPLERPRGGTLARRVAGPLGATLVVAGITVTAAFGGSVAGALAASAAGAPAVGPVTAAEAGAPAVVAPVAVDASGSPADDASGSGVGDDASRSFAAGQPGLAEARLPAAEATAQVERATRTAALLGLPRATSRRATRVVDRFGGGTYDEVTDYDVTGRLLSSQRFAPDGRLLAAVRFGWRSGSGPVLAGPAGARARAERIVATLGLAATGTPRVIAAPSNAGWTVAWGRTVDGVPVPGDGLRIQLWPDGSVHGLARSERPLAERPPVPLDAVRVRAIVEGHLDGWFHGDARRDVALAGLALAWVPPNDTFAPLGPDAPGAVLRLAWVARVATSGALADDLRALEIYVDAGSGSILGGDILE